MALTLSQLEGFKGALATRKGSKVARTVAVASGKGGVGKSSFALSLAVALVAKGNKVLLMDGDPGLADLNIFLGINPPRHWGHFLEGTCSFEDAIFRDIHGFDFLHGFSGVQVPEWISGGSARKLMEAMNGARSNYDWHVVDVGAGLSEPTLIFTTSVEQVLLVLSGELTSLADAYGTLKTILQRNPRQKVGIVVNQVAEEAQARLVHSNLVRIAGQFLGARPPLLGWIPTDPELPRSLARQRPLMMERPTGPYAMAVNGILETLLR